MKGHKKRGQTQEKGSDSNGTYLSPTASIFVIPAKAGIQDSTELGRIKSAGSPLSRE